MVPFSKEDKILIKSLYECKGYNARQFITEFPGKGWMTRVYKTPVGDVSELRQRLIDCWSSLSQDIIDDAIDQWQVRLRACVKAKDATLSIFCIKTGSFQRHPRFPGETCIIFGMQFEKR